MPAICAHMLQELEERVQRLNEGGGGRRPRGPADEPDDDERMSPNIPKRELEDLQDYPQNVWNDGFITSLSLPRS